MADKNTNEAGELQLFFPFKGLNDAMAYKDQIPLTTPLIANCRVKDVEENRARGGQRPGMSKVFAEQVGSEKPILKIVLCTNTYITPE
jgi:hypothetical protein